MINGSVVGTSHEKRGEPCQDYCHAIVIGSDESPILIAACADGAGSSAFAQAGSKIACLAFVRAASFALEKGLVSQNIERATILKWYDEARRHLSLEACIRNSELREFACTLLTAIVTESRCVFSQIGDGAIIVRDSTGYRSIFWPQSGEYASTTFFLTGGDFERHIECAITTDTINTLAIITDGLQPLALHFATRSVHELFFDPMFEALQNTANPEDLELPLRQFLASQPVCERTDDDKTLLLAARRPHELP